MANSSKKLIIFDTDIGGDCDDAGALALCHKLCDTGEAELLAVTCCYETPYVAGCVDAINKYYGRNIPIGVNHDRKVEKPYYGGNYYGYDRYICEKFTNDYTHSENVSDSLTVLRQTLAASDDASVTLVATGYLSSLAKLIQSQGDDVSPLTGKELVSRKVQYTVVMGGRFFEGWPEDFLHGTTPVVSEYNINCDIDAAKIVCDNWCGRLIFSSFEIGAACITLKDFHKYFNENPAACAYHMHPVAAVRGRESWDLTAILYAIRPDSGYWSLSSAGKISVSDDGVTSFIYCEEGMHHFLLPCLDSGEICKIIDDLVMPECQ